ncbi:hypothetical protein LSH36_476g02037 [Paralvinella palmiformis]|uniref:Eyes absent homolog n=1 Tax=Paralvinella palmiformis TaxID=53620 RepID=A0AAD9J944_9ANNE|nr:hypothetical protein LSH36_476g02037 [Paralvinella palmiformis]
MLVVSCGQLDGLVAEFCHPSRSSAADYGAYTGYNQSSYPNPYSYYSYGAAASIGSSSSTSVPSTQTYQLLPPSTSADSQFSSGLPTSHTPPLKTENNSNTAKTWSPDEVKGEDKSPQDIGQ